MCAGVAALQDQQLSNSAGNGWSQSMFMPISCCYTVLPVTGCVGSSPTASTLNTHRRVPFSAMLDSP